jgi:hypothetical protein
MYRYAAEIEFYTKEGHYFQGVGKCLLDQLTSMLDSSHFKHGGYVTEGEELDDGVTPLRNLHSIVVNVPYDKPERLEWMGEWLGNWLNFQQFADLPEMALKNGKWVNHAIFTRKTGLPFDPAKPPPIFAEE